MAASFLVLGKELFGAVLDDGAASDDTDERTHIIHNGDEILTAGTVHQLVHGGGDPDGGMILPPGDLHDLAGLRLTDINVAGVFQTPQQIAFGEGAPVFAAAAENGQGGKAGAFHFFEGLTDGVVII